MYSKVITFNDLDDNPVTEEFYFGLNKAEIAELELSVKGGLSEHLKALSEAENGAEIVSRFRQLISMSVGRKSEDGRRFEKSPEITNDFMQTDAYPTFFMSLIENPGEATEFINGIIPSDIRQKLAEQEEADDQYTDEQLLVMADSEFDRVAGTNPKQMSKRHLQIAFQRKAIVA